MSTAPAGAAARSWALFWRFVLDFRFRRDLIRCVVLLFLVLFVQSWGIAMSYTEVPGIRVPIRMWADPATVEGGAMQQLRNVSSLPWIKGLAVMPDVHYGKGATVGSVIAMHGAVFPAAVGVDIGCGMMRRQDLAHRRTTCPRTSRACARRSSRPSRSAAAAHDGASTPARAHGFPTAGWDDFWARLRRAAPSRSSSSGTSEPSSSSGTLGTGNHFIELCLDEAGRVWLMLHSGSRNIGKGSPTTTSARRAEAAAQPGPGRPRPRRLHRGHPADGRRTGATSSGRRTTPSATARS